jgi:hypothetical protein
LKKLNNYLFIVYPDIIININYMDILELTNVISPVFVNDTYDYIDDLFNIIFKQKRNKSVTIRFDNVSKELQIGVIKGMSSYFSPIYTIDDITNIDENIPKELHSIIVELHKLIDIIVNICFSCKKKVIYFGFYKKEQQMILSTRFNVKKNPSYIYDRLLYDTK